jgi:hypothetical protein
VDTKSERARYSAKIAVYFSADTEDAARQKAEAIAEEIRTLWANTQTYLRELQAVETQYRNVLPRKGNTISPDEPGFGTK